MYFMLDNYDSFVYNLSAYCLLYTSLPIGPSRIRFP